MQTQSVGNRLIVKLDRGQEMLSTLTQLCKDKGITCASLTGIGAVSHSTLGYYDLESFTYLTQDYEEICELVSLQGNVAILDGEPFVHAHAGLGFRDMRLRGGHLVRATVAVTVEIVLHIMDTKIERKQDPEVRLNLLDLG